MWHGRPTVIHAQDARATPINMLIDSFAPNPDVVEAHRTAIAASPKVVYHSLWTADLGDSLIIKLLFRLAIIAGIRRPSPISTAK